MPLLTRADALNPEAAELTQDMYRMYDEYVDYLASPNDSGPPRPAGIHASEISHCYRQAVYTMRGEPKVHKPRDRENAAYWARNMAHGHGIHAIVQNDLKNMAERSNNTRQFEAEVKLSPNDQCLAAKWNIHSSCDGIITKLVRNPDTWRYDPVARMGIEIKSMKSSLFSKLREPKPEHVEQVHVYMAVLDLPSMWMIYYDKDTQNMTPSTPPWVVPFNPSLWEKLEKRFEAWHKNVEDGTLPEPMPGQHCDFCGYASVCNPPTRVYIPKVKPTHFT